MNRFRILLVVFFLVIAAPLGYFVVRTHVSLGQEERAELRYFTETLFGRMEEELASLVLREESRAVDQYSYLILRPGETPDSSPGIRSPLSYPPGEPYLLGYFQNNPDGTFQTPMKSGDMPPSLDEYSAAIKKMQELNVQFNTLRSQDPPSSSGDESHEMAAGSAGRAVDPSVKRKKESRLQEKYFSPRQDSEKNKLSLGQETQRMEEITMAQAEQILERKAASVPMLSSKSGRPLDNEQVGADRYGYSGTDVNRDGDGGARASSSVDALSRPAVRDRGSSEISDLRGVIPLETFRVEVAPLQSVLLDDQHLFLFRRIVINGRIYSQGFVVVIPALLDHLVVAHYNDQPLSRFSSIKLAVVDQGKEIVHRVSGETGANDEFYLEHRFPRPFSFLTASITSAIPPAAGRRTLVIMTVACGFIVVLGFIVVYQSVRVVVEHSERRSGFVSSVTHELKTPLTTIRMYVEMLEQGIAGSPEQEEEYFRILMSETGRLSRLINNVLEFSRLDRQQRPVNLVQGDLSEVIREVTDGMAEKMRQEGFTLDLHCDEVSAFHYDREAMIQILINLLDNSIKFGRDMGEKKIRIRLAQNQRQTSLSVSDTGPGIDGKALQRVFDDFYREDNSLTRKTQGTGIGLALVKKLTATMGGTVAAANNPGSGCTITITLPR